MTTALKSTDLVTADEGSYYTILGCGGDLSEWTTGYNTMLKAEEIGVPEEWFTTTGADINEYASTRGTVIDPFKDDLTVLMFRLDGLNVSKLALLKVACGDRWFDDVVNNMAFQADADASDEDDDEGDL